MLANVSLEFDLKALTKQNKKQLTVRISFRQHSDGLMSRHENNMVVMDSNKSSYIDYFPHYFSLRFNDFLAVVRSILSALSRRFRFGTSGRRCGCSNRDYVKEICSDS